MILSDCASSTGSWSPNLCLLTMPDREVISIEWTLSSEQSSEHMSWLLFPQVETLSTVLYVPDSVSALLKAFCVFPWVLTSQSTVHTNPSWASLISKCEPQCFQIRSIFSAHSKPQVEWTWSHVTDCSPKSSTLKIVYTISFWLGVYEWHLNLCFIFGYQLKDNSFYMCKYILN